MNKITYVKMNKKKLDYMFYKVLLKLYSNTKNLTDSPMPIDLVREEIHLLVFVLITLDVKLTLIKLSNLSLEEINFNILVDSVIKGILLSSKQNIFFILSLTKSNTLETSNQWLLRKIQTEEYSSVVTIMTSVNSKYPLDNKSFNLITSLIESLIIKLANYMIYELFSYGKLSERIYLKSYAIDYLLFSYNLDNLKTYSYWKYYIQNLYVNIKRFSTDSRSLLICTKNGLEFKKLYNKELQVSLNSSNLQKLISKYLDFVEYVKTIKK